MRFETGGPNLKKRNKQEREQKDVLKSLIKDKQSCATFLKIYSSIGFVDKLLSKALKIGVVGSSLLFSARQVESLAVKFRGIVVLAIS
jgi:hypothetical protein